MKKGNEIYISESEWTHLNSTHSTEEIKKMISDTIEEHNIPMPLRNINHVDAIDDFLALSSMKSNTIVKNEEWVTRYEYSYPLSSVLFKATNIGNKSSDYYHQYNRWMCDSVNSPSPYRTWNNEKFRLTLLNALWSLKVKSVDMGTLRTCIGLRKYIASQFRPSAAKALIEYFNAESVLDFSSGWGDRLSGFMASNATHYTGVDPNSNLLDSYDKQIELFGGNKNIEMIEGCAEEVVYDRKYNLVFTSPPYFNIERYTQDNTQSFKRYKKIEDWNKGFLFPAIENAWNSLEENGIMAINISDVYSGHKVNNICDPMNDFISTLNNAEYIGCYGYEMRKRPNSGALKNKVGVFAEPIWIWKKRTK